MARFTLPRDLYHGKGSLENLKTLTGKKAIVVVGGGSMKRNGFLDKAVDYLKEAGMEVRLFENVEPDPSVETVMKGAAAMTEFQPDWIVAMGGGSPIDAAKAMWAFYEYPETTFEDLITPFNFPTLRTKAKFCAIPSTSGTATEVTAFSVITDYSKGIKYPLADFNITPDVAIVDPVLAETMPKKLTAHTGMDAMTHAIEAYVSTLHCNYTDPLALHAIKMIHSDLKKSFDGDMTARDNMHDAQCLAGMAFSNALLGIVHSMAHKTGAAFSGDHIIHGCANAMYLPKVIKYNSKNAEAAERYAEIAKFIGLTGNTNEELVNALISELRSMNDQLEIPQAIKYYGAGGVKSETSVIDENEFIEKLPETAKNAIGDACTGSNPRQPSQEEMEKLLSETGTIQDLLEQHDFYQIDTKVEEIGRALGLTEIGLERDVTELSGGQRTKVLLGKLLLEKPDILLLDEPTNYLDEQHIEWLKRYLNDYENAFILISHDIPFLNKVVNVIYHLENCELTRYSGDYDKFQEMYAIYQSQKAAAYERQQQEVAKLEDFIARNKARVATTNMAKSRQRKLDKMEMIEKPREKLKPTFKFTEARTPSRFIVEAKDLVLGYDSPLTRPVTFNLERGQKIAIRGVNGLGKTTLLKTILGIIPPVSGKVELGEFLEPGYFEQEEREKNENTALDDVWNEYPGLTNYEVRAALAGCGLTNEHITSKVFVLSGGEAAKVRLCKLMLKDVNWLVLDEPTNHLDVDAKDELKRALKEFKGSVLLVSHEPEFYEDWVDKVWNIEDWTTKII